MGQFLLLVVVALTVGAVVFGVTVLLTGSDPGLSAAEPDGRAVPLPGTRPLVEDDIEHVRFDTALRGYRMAQVDQAMRRAAYDIGYKDELINVLEAEVAALRSGRFPDAEVLRRAREAARSAAGATVEPTTDAATETDSDVETDSAAKTDSAAEVTAVAAVAAGALETADPTAVDWTVVDPAAVDPAAADPLVGQSTPSGDEAAEAGSSGTGSDADSSPVESPVGSSGDSPAAESDLSEPVEVESDFEAVETAGVGEAGARQSGDGVTPEAGAEAADATSGSDPNTVLPSRR
jgi:DivIVA domain-containing protein